MYVARDEPSANPSVGLVRRRIVRLTSVCRRSIPRLQAARPRGASCRRAAADHGRRVVAGRWSRRGRHVITTDRSPVGADE